MSALKALFTNVPWCCLSATLTEKGVKDVVKILCLSEVQVVHVIGSRHNIKYNLKDVRSEKYESLNWYIELLAYQKQNSPKAIIYCRNVANVAHIFAYICDKLGDNQYVNNVTSYTSRTVGMFHRSTADINKDHILTTFPTEASNIRCVIATDAFGMGIDIPDVKYVINYSAPRSMESFSQQSGRGGRNGDNAEAHLYVLPQNKSKKQTDTSMLGLIKSTSCIRLHILSHFELSHAQYIFKSEDEPSSKCKCCNVCSNQCSCLQCNNLLDEKDMFNDGLTDLQITQQRNEQHRSLTTEDVAFLKANLLNYYDVLIEKVISEGHVFYSPEITTPFTKKDIETVCDNCNYINTPEDIMAILNWSSDLEPICQNILEIVDEC